MITRSHQIILFLLIFHQELICLHGYITAKSSSEIVKIPDPPAPKSHSKSNCPHLQSGLLDWEDSSTWNGLTSPASGADVTLPTNSKVLVSKAISYVLGNVKIPTSSELIFAEDQSSTIKFKATGIEVKGALRIGSETCLIETPIEVTLFGARPGNIYFNPKPTVYKGISVTGSSAKLELHGKRYFRTWSRLAETVTPGSKSMILQNEVNWESGQKIVLVTTAIKDAREFHQNEVFVVDYIQSPPSSGLGSIVHIKSSAKYTHIANSGYQAEVGLLSRMIRIAGSAGDSEPTDPDPLNCVSERNYWGNNEIQCSNKELTGFGGHIIIENGGKGFVEGVELYRMGQTNVLGRYPMHFHILGNGCKDCYFRYSSIHRSYYRCVSIHGTNSVVVTENVGYDVTGYCYYLEDGVEEDNVISFNLAAHIHYLGTAPGGFGQETELNYQGENLLLPADVTASGFYITNVHNDIIGNAASGGWAGFAFPVLQQPIGQHKNVNMRPSSRTSLTIDGNTAHSTGWWWIHACAFYFGGTLFFNSDGESLIYNAGRDHTRLRSPCLKDQCAVGGCDWFCEPVDQAWIRMTNTKAFLVPGVGLNSWSGRMEVIKYEAHDVGLGLEALEDGFWIDKMLVVCRTGVTWELPENSFPYFMSGDGFFWYDTFQKHIITRSIFRNCGYRSSEFDQYDSSPNRGCGNSEKSGCESGSTTFGFLTHSDEFNPNQMQATKDITYENCGRRYRLFNFNGDQAPSTVSGRLQNWMDEDGSASGLNEPTIMCSGQQEAGKWWHVDNDVVDDSQGPLKFVRKNNGPEREIGFFVMKWDESQHRKVGGSICGNGNQAACPTLGYIKHIGPMFESDKGLPITANAYVSGITGGFGWLLELNDGAPHSLKLELIEVLPDSPLLLSIAYPPETSFTITAYAAYCNPDGTYTCKETFQPVNTVEKVRSSLGNTYHFADGLLTLRIVQTAQTFTGNPDWILPDYDTPGKWGNGYALNRFSREGVYLPKPEWGPFLEILADCSKSGAYCSKKPNKASLQVCPNGYTQTAYDTCCKGSDCIFANDGISPTPNPPTNNPPTPVNPPTPTNNPPSPNTCPSKTKKKNKKNKKKMKSKKKNKKKVKNKKKARNLNNANNFCCSWDCVCGNSDPNDWCNLSQSNCEACEGDYIDPTEPIETSGCCSWGGVCGDDKWCNCKKENCENSCGGVWKEYCCAWDCLCGNPDPGDWCNLSAENCAACEGDFINPDEPIETSGCCSWGGVCGDDKWCNCNQENCEGSCNGEWCPF